MKKLFIALLIGIGIYAYVQSNPAVISSFTSKSVQNNQVITDAYQNRLSDIQVSGSGKVSFTEVSPFFQKFLDYTNYLS